MNRDKRMITNSILVKDAVLKQVVNTLPVVTGLTTKKEMAGFYEDYRGIVVAGASKPIPQLGWILLTEIDEDEILSFMRLMLMSAPIPAVIIIIMGMLLFITFFKKHAIAEVAFDATGRPIQMLGTVQDITEQKRMEEEADLLRRRQKKH